MKLEEMPIKDLLALHNRIADKPAGPKTFATRVKLVARIKQVAADKNIDLSSSGQPKKPKATAQRVEPKAEATETPEAAEKKSRGLGVGALARAILMDPAGHPHVLIAEMVNAQIAGAAATAKSVRWYANDMRKKGVEVPPRQKHHPADMDEVQSAEALSTVRVVEPAPSDD
ncbi:hypothetical protein [Xanthomonas phaseoli]|uniref:Uncharacterized protein n=1 Tax=Xanthomonas manihotis TaxID=43353 RepID=A0A8I1XQZ5_XANMN|nr:hypothetical protein [Xanthomonas phaseoli]RWU14037.1 hypothetical protein XANMN_20085 [Xanthomonas phaseoli pv. manihotis str. CIO151]KUF21407.1 hypothetical protein AO826_02980 [Xanthomonas phaseoli pv. manihotis]MBO9720739.1 hypothetical protein [Xanthomonas phaseoli pv. manihotis]MBO9755295.1 hypothetical protein [Xanthomonas phaseoli pv. manihotis]MBO9761627.1 hypothetical protein [Xanthomonas phaseoli pv. manihotis]